MIIATYSVFYFRIKFLVLNNRSMLQYIISYFIKSSRAFFERKKLLKVRLLVSAFGLTLLSSPYPRSTKLLFCTGPVSIRPAAAAQRTNAGPQTTGKCRVFF